MHYEELKKQYKEDKSDIKGTLKRLLEKMPTNGEAPSVDFDLPLETPEGLGELNSALEDNYKASSLVRVQKYFC